MTENETPRDTPLALARTTLDTQLHAVTEAVTADLSLEDLRAIIALGLQGELAAKRLSGRALNLAKDKLPHGAFGDWIGAHFDLSHDSANDYMALDRDWERVMAEDPTVNSIRAVQRVRDRLDGKLAPPRQNTGGARNVVVAPTPPEPALRAPEDAAAPTHDSAVIDGAVVAPAAAPVEDAPLSAAAVVQLLRAYLRGMPPAEPPLVWADVHRVVGLARFLDWYAAAHPRHPRAALLDGLWDALRVAWSYAGAQGHDSWFDDPVRSYLEDPQWRHHYDAEMNTGDGVIDAGGTQPPPDEAPTAP